jgi:hypothetical protein
MNFTISRCALIPAVRDGNEEMVKFLVLEMNANVNIITNHKFSYWYLSPLTTAIFNSNESLVKLLIEELGADVNFRLMSADEGPPFLPIHVAMYTEAYRQVSNRSKVFFL